MSSPLLSCPRCGVRRIARADRSTLCAGCRTPIPKSRKADALKDGHWESKRGIQVWVRHYCYCGAPLVGPNCDTCLAWAEKDARLHADRADSWAHRHLIWDVLEMRKDAKEAA